MDEVSSQADVELKKKQKSGLNAVRPDDYVERMFKDMAKEKNFSQTEMFERIFWSYITDQTNEKMQQAVNLDSEINLISKDLDNIMQHFKAIVEKSQQTVISVKANAEQTEKNLTMEVDTLKKTIDELGKRNFELEQSNNVFNEVKAGLESKISELAELNAEKDNALEEYSSEIKEKDKQNKELQKQIVTLEKDNEKLQKELPRINNLETLNSSLNSTLNNLEAIKKSEISAIEAKYKVIITDLETKLNSYGEAKTKELKELKNSLSLQHDADKKNAIADMKLEIAELKTKYAEVLSKPSSKTYVRKRI